jgi:hypothetical protein
MVDNAHSVRRDWLRLRSDFANAPEDSFRAFAAVFEHRLIGELRA